MHVDRIPGGVLSIGLALYIGGCAGGGCVSLSSEGGAKEASPGPIPPDIVLISLDTVRQDRGPGPWGAGAMPNYASFASLSDHYTQAWAPSSNTLVSHGSLFTGLYPWEHTFHPRRAAPTNPPDLFVKLAERGYHTAVFTTHPLWLGEAHGFDAGAQAFRSEAVSGEQVLEWVDEWLEDPPPAPRALFVHLYDAHSDTHQLPYEAPQLPEVALGFGGCLGDVCASKALKAVDAKRAELPEGADEAIRAAYTAGVNHTDALLGQLLQRLEPTLGEGLVAVFSDHGELLGEHGAWLHHGASPWVLDIPLAVKRPGQKRGRAIGAPVSLVDLYGTVLEVAGIPEPARLSLEGAVRGRRGRAVAMGAARLGARMAYEREGGELVYLTRSDDGNWVAGEADPRLARLATNPVEAVMDEDIKRLTNAEHP